MAKDKAAAGTRTVAMDALSRAYHRAEAGRGSVAIVSGEAGVGKTWLVGSFLQAPDTSRATVLVGGCLDIRQGGPPYWPIIEAFRSLQREFGDSAPDKMGPAWSEFSELLPGVAPGSAPAGKGAESERSQYRLFEVVLSVLESLSRSGPVVLLIEDLHWADRSTRDLLSFLAANVSNLPVFLLGTYRTDELLPSHPLHPMLAELFRLQDAQLVELPRLTGSELEEMLRARLGMRPKTEVVDEIWERSDGNPFFAQELLTSVLAGQAELPPTLRQILHARLARLQQDEQQVLRTAHVAGGTVRHELLEAVGQLSEPDLQRAVRSCVANKILVIDSDAGAYAFRHSLYREAIDEDLLPGERKGLHIACAEAISRNRALAQGSASTELARHWLSAGQLEAALPATVAAAQASEQAFGYAEALAHYEQAIDISGKISSRALGIDLLDLLERAAECANLAGDHRRATQLAEQASNHCSRTSDAVRAACIWERRGRYLADAGASEDALLICERAVRTMPSEPETAELARVLGTYAETLMLAGSYRRARQEASRALEIARRTSGLREEARVLGILGFIVAYLGEGDPVGLLNEALAIAREDGDPDDVGRVYVHLAGLLSGPLNRLEESIDVAQEGLDQIAELGLLRTHGVFLQAGIVNTLFRMGRWEEADRWVEKAVSSKPQGAAAIDLHLARARILIGRGDLQDARQALRRARALSTRAIDPKYRAPLATLEAGLALWRGNIEEAREAVDAGLSGLTTSEEVWFAAPLVWHGLRVEADSAESALARRDDVALARARRIAGELMTKLTALLKRISDASDSIKLSLAAYEAICLAELTRMEGHSSAPAWEKGGQLWDRVSHPYPAAYCRFRQAEALLAGGSRSTQVAELLREASRTAARLGAGPFKREVDALARRAGISTEVAAGQSTQTTTRDPAEEAAGKLGLTPREIEVLRLVAQGSTNREVARTLFISEKTAGVHVSHILTKLGVRNRAQAGALAHRLALTAPESTEVDQGI